MEVVILAGGLGTRLRAAVADTPKCLAPVAGRPFLQWLLEWLALYPVDKVIFSVGYLKEQVIDFVHSGNWPFTCLFASEESPLGTGGAIANALKQCSGHQVVVLNGDTFFPLSLSDLPFGAPVTLALKQMSPVDRYGTVSLGPSGEVTAFHERKSLGQGLINGGVYAIDRSRLDLTPYGEKFSFERDVLPGLAASGGVRGWESPAWFIDIGVGEDYARAQWALPAWKAVQRASKAVLATSAHTLFLDRDGVVNRLREGDYVKTTEEFEFMPGILEALALWAAKFPRIVMVTNQRGVGKGLMSEADLSRIHAHMMARILESGGRIDLILTCTATSDEDPRRKPHPGMFHEARALFPDISPENSVMLGDSPSDAAFARAAGMRFIPF